MDQQEDNKNKQTSHLVRCDCGDEVLSIDQYEYFGMKDFELCIFERYYHRSLYERFRYVWKVLTTGRPFGDQIVLSKEKVEELTKWLQKRLEE